MSGTSVLRLLAAARLKGTGAVAYFFVLPTEMPLGCASCFNLNLSERDKGEGILVAFLSKVYKK